MKLYGVYSVMGNFGSWKTFWTFLEISNLDKEKNFIIANVPYKFVDLFYSLPEELYKIIQSLEDWIDKTNNDVENYFFNKAKYKNIIIVVDEAHLYFNARKRDKGGLMERLDVILTQCRKRNIKILFISQRLKRVDLNIRRMTDYVVRYKRTGIPILWTQRSIRTVYENEWDLADIQGDEGKTYVMNSEQKGPKTDIEKAVLESSMFWPLFKLFWLPIWKRLSYWDFKNFDWEAHNSYFISWLRVGGTQTSFEEEDLIVEERPLSEKEKKIKAWIHKHLPTLVNFLKPKKEKNEYGQFRRSSITDNQGSNASTSSNSKFQTFPNIDDRLRERNLWSSANNANTTKRIASFGELRKFEDWLLNGKPSTNSNTFGRVKIKA